MNKPFITILALLLIAGTSYAQFTLQNGQAPFYQLVKQPYFYYDLVRSQQNAWIRQYRESTSQPWGNSNLLINRKDANGDFTYLEYSLWNWNSMSWDVYNKFVTERKVNGTQLVEETKLEWFRDEEDNLRHLSTRNDISWENGRPKQVRRVTNSEGTQPITSNIYFKFDANNRRIHDSEAVNERAWENKYVYDSLGQCTANYLVTQSDTIMLTTYAYTGRLLTNYKVYNYVNTPELQSEDQYEYDTRGRVTQATLSGIGSTTVMYKHGYNNSNDDRLLWMCSYYYEDGQWNKSDSIAFTYTGAHADTSYGYLSTDRETWNAWPSFRFLFDDDRVGVNEAKQYLDFNVYPNPASSKITIGTRPGVSVNRVIVSDLTGKTIIDLVPLPSGEIDVTGISPGIYMMRVESKDQSGIKKLVIR